MKFNFKSILKSGIITNKPLHFYIILFVLMVVQTMLFEYIAPFEREPTFRKMLLIATADVAFTIWIITNCGKILKRREYQTTLPAS